MEFEYETNRRLEIENEYLALLLNKEEILELIQVRPEYLSNRENQKMLKYIKECYEENNCINVGIMADKHSDFNFELYIQLLNGTICHLNTWQENLKVYEESIVKSYKEDIIKTLNKKVEMGIMRYDEFIEKMKILDDIILIKTTSRLTKQEMLENINEDKIKIKLNNFSKLDELLRIVQNDFVIIGATTGAGKSGLLLNLMNDLMYRYQCIYFNMEMSKSTIYKRMISIKTGVPLDDITKPQSEMQKEIVMNSMTEIEKAKVIIEHRANDIKQIKAIVGKVKEKDRHTILFIDHLGLCRCDSTRNLYEQVTEVAKQLRQICLEYDCTIISASQLNRGAYGNNEISLSMLKDSGELENSASKVLLLYKESKNDNNVKDTKMNLEIAKNRDGICGVVKMHYNKTKQIFTEERGY